MKLSSRPVDLDNDLIQVSDFLQGRQRWQPLPAYWNTGKSRIAIYLTMFEGSETNHQVWEDETTQIQAYTYLSPDEKTPIYSTPEVREWRVFIHPEQRTKQMIHYLIQDVESKLNFRDSSQPITTVAYESDLDWVEHLVSLGYIKRSAKEVYMTRSLTDPIPRPTIPEGYIVRPFAGKAEILSRASLTDSAFGGFEGPSEWSVNNVNHMLQFCHVTKAIDFVATTTAGLIISSGIGFCDPVTKLGEFDPVGTHRDYQQQGLAKSLLLTGLHWMKGAGMHVAVIRTEEDNIPAQHAYQSVGFQTVDRLFLYEKV